MYLFGASGSIRQKSCLLPCKGFVKPSSLFLPSERQLLCSRNNDTTLAIQDIHVTTISYFLETQISLLLTMVVYPSCPIISFYFSTNPKLKMSTTSAKMSAEPLHLLDPARPQLSQQKNQQPRKNSKKSDTRKEKYLNSECSFTSLQNRRNFGGRVLSIILGKSWLPSLIFTAVKGWERNLYQGGE